MSDDTGMEAAAEIVLHLRVVANDCLAGYESLGLVTAPLLDRDGHATEDDGLPSLLSVPSSLVRMEVEDECDLRVPHVCDQGREKEECMVVREG